MIITREIPTFAVSFENGEDRALLKQALAMASFQLAEPLGLDSETDPAYDPDDVLTAEEAQGYVTDDGIIMLFAKGRVCMSHLTVSEDARERLVIRFEMFEGDPTKLLRVTDRILRSLAEQALESSQEDEELDIIVEIEEPDDWQEVKTDPCIDLLTRLTA